MPPSHTSLRSFFAKGSGSGLIDKIDLEKIPGHIAIIMDGNGRWAASRGLPRLAGHRAGTKAVREAIACSLELGVKTLTIYSFSSENWSRPANEVFGLMDLFVEVLQQELSNIQKMGVRVIVAGNREQLPALTADAFRKCELETANNTAMTLVVALNYGGRDDILRATRKIAEACLDGAITPNSIDETLFSAHLYTAQVPDPDLVIRTSGEMRLSNFLLWQIAYSELWVTDTLWPDFDRHELLQAIVEYQGRHRRFGGSE